MRRKIDSNALIVTDTRCMGKRVRLTKKKGDPKMDLT